MNVSLVLFWAIIFFPLLFARQMQAETQISPFITQQKSHDGAIYGAISSLQLRKEQNDFNTLPSLPILELNAPLRKYPTYPIDFKITSIAYVKNPPHSPFKNRPRLLKFLELNMYYNTTHQKEMVPYFIINLPYFTHRAYSSLGEDTFLPQNRQGNTEPNMSLSPDGGSSYALNKRLYINLSYHLTQPETLFYSRQFTSNDILSKKREEHDLSHNFVVQITYLF